MDPDRDEVAWLVDWNGKLLKTVNTHSRNTSGIAYGNGCVWMGANADLFGIFQIDLNSNQVSHRQIPLSIDGNGGGCHGLKWHDGKLWIAALRLGGILRIDPTTWVPEVLIRVSSEEKPRLHDAAFDNEGNVWIVTGNNSSSYADGKAGLNKYDGKTGHLLMTVDFQPGSCDPHGLVWHDGRLISCDAGVRPGTTTSIRQSEGRPASVNNQKRVRRLRHASTNHAERSWTHRPLDLLRPTPRQEIVERCSPRPGRQGSPPRWGRSSCWSRSSIGRIGSSGCP